MCRFCAHSEPPRTCFCFGHKEDTGDIDDKNWHGDSENESPHGELDDAPLKSTRPLKILLSPPLEGKKGEDALEASLSGDPALPPIPLRSVWDQSSLASGADTVLRGKQKDRLRMGLFASRHWREFCLLYLIFLHILFIFPSSFHFKSHGTKMIILGLSTSLPSLLLPPFFFFFSLTEGGKTVLICEAVLCGG